MKNQPHNTNFAPRVRTPTPEPPEIKDEDEDQDQLQEESNKESEKSKTEGTEEEKEQKGEKSKNEEEENNGMALNENGENGEPPAKKAKQEKAPKDLYKMPMFLPLEVDENGKEISMKVPEKMEKQKTQDFQVNQVIIRVKKITNEIFPFTKFICFFSEQESDREVSDLLNSHMGHWQDIRKRWRDAALFNETRYKDSLDVLKEMFEK